MLYCNLCTLNSQLVAYQNLDEKWGHVGLHCRSFKTMEDTLLENYHALPETASIPIWAPKIQSSRNLARLGAQRQKVLQVDIIKRPEVCNDDVNISPKNPPLVILACKKKACKPEHQQHFAKLFSHSSRRLRIYTKFWRCC